MKKFFNGFSAVVLALAILVSATVFFGTDASAWNGTAATSFAGGSGTQNDPYLIKTANQYGYFLNEMDNGRTFSGEYVRIDADLDLTGYKRKLNVSKGFAGTLDGVCHTVTTDSGFLPSILAEGTVRRVNLVLGSVEEQFGLCYSNSGVIEAVTIRGTLPSAGGNYSQVGLLCVNNQSSGIIRFCGAVGSASASNSGDSYAGMVARNYGTIKKSYSAVIATATSSGDYSDGYDHPVGNEQYGSTDSMENVFYDSDLYKGYANGAKGLTTEYMKSSQFLTDLSNYAMAGTNWVTGSDGYPTLEAASTDVGSPEAGQGGHVHYVCGLECNHKVKCEIIAYAPMKGISLPSGNYYMESDSESITRTVKSGDTVSICLNGHVMAYSGNYFLKVEEGGVLEICDCQGTGSIRRYYGTGDYVVVNYGDLTIYNGQYGVWGSQGIHNYGNLEIYEGIFRGTFTNEGKAVIHNADISTEDVANRKGIYNTESGELTIHDGRYYSDDIVLLNYGDVVVKNGVFTSGSKSVVYNQTGSVDIYDGTFTATGENAAIVNMDGSWSSYGSLYSGLSINGGTISGYIGVLNDSDDVGTSQDITDACCSIGGGKITGTLCGVMNGGNTWLYTYGYQSKELHSRAVLRLSGSPEISKVIMEYPDSLMLGTLETPVTIELDMDNHSVGDVICSGDVDVRNLTLVPEGYLLTYDYNAGGMILKTNNCGQEGSDVHWVLTKDGVLRIYGQGEMGHFGFSAYEPWYSFADQITSVVVEPGVTSIGEAAFAYLSNLTEITIADTVTHIHDYCLEGNNALKKIVFPKNLQYIGNAFAIHGNPTAELFFDGCEHMWQQVTVSDRASFTVTCKDFTAEDDGDCTTAVLCSVCDKVIVEAKSSHSGGTATCTEKAKCAICGKIYGDVLPHSWADATCEKAKTCTACGKTEGKALGHDWKAATCDKPKTCSRCGKTEGAPNGHVWMQANCENPRTCEVCGKTDGKALGHKWDAATCETAKTCSVCDKTEGKALGHKWVNATCDKAKTCATCGKAEGAALGHDWKNATCDKPKTCSRCAKTEGAAAGHKWNAATCEAPKTCAACGKMEGAALGHKWADATCEKAKTCQVCGKTEGSPVGHNWNAATCETPKTCTVCAKTEGKAKGHSWKNATCDKPKTCTVCRKTEGAALGHNWNNATCDKAKTCAGCGKTEGAALGHKWNAASCDKAKTCAACGKTDGVALGHNWNAATCEKAKTCTVCGKVEGAPKGHSWKAATCDKAKTCAACGKTEGTALGHNWNPATCDKAKTCAVCGKTEGTALGHKWNAATCDKAKTCATCGKTEGIPLGHNWNAATCDKAKTCTVCGKVDGAPKGHNWKSATCDKAKTCQVCGKIEGAALGHSWITATCETAKICTSCGKTEGAALGHKWTAATCTTPKTCASCGKTEGSVKDHSWDAGTVTKPATETAEGLKTFKCTACGETKTEKIPVLSHTHKYTDKVTAPTCITEGYTTHTCACGHSYTDSKVPATGHKNAKDAAVAATCTKEGLTEGSHCSVCGTVIQKQQTVPAKGHSWDKGTVTKPATETAEGVLTYKCTACSESRTESIPMLDHVHKYTDKIVAPTCTAEGYTIHTCVCGHSYNDSQVPAKGHAWDKGTVTKEPTEISEGVKTFKCTACGETKSESIPVLDHVHKYESVVVAPTCISEGYTNHTCVCGHSYTDSKVPATGHKPVKDAAVAATCTKEGLTEGSHCSVCAVVLTSQQPVPAKGHAWDKGTVTKEPTENAEGVKTYKCASCGETKTESIPALGHTHKYESKVVAPTCTAEGYTTHTCACGHSYTDSKVPATGHKPVKDAAVAATCTKEGLTEGSHCSVCAVVLTAQQPVPAKGHAWDNGTVTKEPTENAEGVKTYQCASCGETRTESIPALGHTHKYESKVVAPTCTAEGYTTHTCACGYSYTDSKVPAKGHAWDNGSVTKEPTENAEGVKTFQCASCGETKTESIPALGHTHKYENGVCVGCGEVQILASGTIGKYITWKLDAKGVLTISGTGLVELILEKIFPRTMGDAILVNNAPWMSYAEKIQKVVVEEGVTGLGEGAFLGCTALEEVTVAGSVADLGAYTFADCDALKIVTVEGAAPAIGENCFRNVEGCIVHPANDETWTEDILSAAGGKMTLATQRPDAPAIKPGDVNGDGKADYSDALKILRASIGLETLTEALKAAADVNGDGKADYSDALKILRASIGLETL